MGAAQCNQYVLVCAHWVPPSGPGLLLAAPQPTTEQTIWRARSVVKCLAQRQQHGSKGQNS